MRGCEGRPVRRRQRLQLGGATKVSVTQQLVVRSAVDVAVPHAEVVPLGKQDPAGGAGETAEVEHSVTGAHDQLASRDAGQAARTPLHREQPRKETLSLYIVFVQKYVVNIKSHIDLNSNLAYFKSVSSPHSKC